MALLLTNNKRIMNKKEQIKDIVSRLKEITNELTDLCNESDYKDASFISEQSTFIEIATENLEDLV